MIQSRLPIESFIFQGKEFSEKLFKFLIIKTHKEISYSEIIEFITISLSGFNVDVKFPPYHLIISNECGEFEIMITNTDYQIQLEVIFNNVTWYGSHVK